MASEGLSGVSSAPPEDQREDGTHLTDSQEAGVPADPDSGKDTLKATAGESP